MDIYERSAPSKRRGETLAPHHTAASRAQVVPIWVGKDLSMPTSDSSAELFKKLQKTQGSYEEEMKSFALTLNFFSSKAYEFVREALSLNLPHPSTLRR
ncbi:hypothetical protein AVEN_234763-1 [Araneus ventricosus]|uniref:THAP9-like helix-turn-helix domain-containing protein n=1 Tax=Araneus ventricosus TaxID=182803 RepID=A0A4Y2UTZ5_ARAVE|nr:hypothetical protein AVEN_101330-1 [Araneus ventricosus]GBO14927.1 hypothetical protein AVEN_234763-1 [Araneus ventricosus]